MALDVTSEANYHRAAEEHVRTVGKLSVLVNKSAMQEVCKDVRDIDLAVVDKTFQTNILSMFAVTEFALPHMRRGAAIINSCSTAGYAGNLDLVDYSSTKGAIATFTRALAQQQAPRSIRVIAVAPGIIWTPLQPATKGNSPEAMKEIGVGEVPLNRPGMPIEVASAYVFKSLAVGNVLYRRGPARHRRHGDAGLNEEQGMIGDAGLNEEQD